jgi:Cys-tRNA(Pro)/Cys-tRNA(Cys) deacylase
MAKRKQASGGTPATVALSRAGIDFTVRSYEHDPSVAADVSYGEEAAVALGVDPARVFKTLLGVVDQAGGSSRSGRLAVAIVPVTGKLDLKALARALGGKRAQLAEPADAERVTGYVVGGISPVGQKRRLPTVLDATALEHATVLVSGGRRGMDIELAPADLVAVTGARVADLRA